MSINAVKGVEIGEGFHCVGQRGSEHRDEMTPISEFLSNNAGGILAGISTGQTVRASLAFKGNIRLINFFIRFPLAFHNHDSTLNGMHQLKGGGGA